MFDIDVDDMTAAQAARHAVAVESGALTPVEEPAKPRARKAAAPADEES